MSRGRQPRPEARAEDTQVIDLIQIFQTRITNNYRLARQNNFSSSLER